jgi:hypothetical protein
LARRSSKWLTASHFPVAKFHWKFPVWFSVMSLHFSERWSEWWAIRDGHWIFYTL